MGRILVTGGAGFIGSALVRSLARRAEAVLVVDDLSASGADRLGGLEVGFARLDIRDRPELDEVVRRFRPEAVVHLAAIHHIPSCEADPPHAMSVNVVGTESLLCAAAAHGVKRVLLASSGAVYAWRDGPLSEDAPVLPSDVYAISKATNEAQLARWCRVTGGDGRIARIFNVVGPGDRTAHLVPDLLARAAAAPVRGGAVTVAVGTTSTTRDFVDLRDCVAGLEAVLQAPGPLVAAGEPPRAFNIASGEARSVRDVAASVGDALGRRVELEMHQALVRRSDRPSQTGDPTRAAVELGWRARFTLADAIMSIVQPDAVA